MRELLAFLAGLGGVLCSMRQENPQVHAVKSFKSFGLFTVLADQMRSKRVLTLIVLVFLMDRVTGYQTHCTQSMFHEVAWPFALPFCTLRMAHDPGHMIL